MNTAQQVESDAQELTRGIDRLQSDFDAMLAAEDDDGFATAVGEGRMSVSEYLESVTERKASIAKQIGDLDNWRAGIRKELRRLREEADFSTNTAGSCGDLGQSMRKCAALSGPMTNWLRSASLRRTSAIQLS